MIIKLTKGYETVVDDDLYSWLSQFNWYAQLCGLQYRPARRLTTEGRELIYIYHQILHVEPWDMKGLEVDHINRDPLDNRRENLRLVTHQQNMQNIKNKSLGISIDRTHGTWKAYINSPYRGRINIGTFKTEAEAVEARRAYLASNR